MKFLVLIKEVPDTWGERSLDLATGRIDRRSADQVLDEISERALEVALSYRDSHKDSRVVVVSMGPATIIHSLRRALSLGADSAVHLVDDELAGADLLFTARALAAVVRDEGFDVVLAGNESTDGRGGVLPAMIAELLGVPQLTFAQSVEFDGEVVRGQRGMDNRSVMLSAGLPAVVSVTERLPDARFPNLKSLMAAKKRPIRTVRLSELSLGTAHEDASVVLSAAERPPRSAGVKVVDSGNAGNELAEFLSAERFI